LPGRGKKKGKKGKNKGDGNKNKTYDKAECNRVPDFRMPSWELPCVRLKRGAALALIVLKGMRKIWQRFSPRRVISVVPRRQGLSPGRVNKMRRPRRQGKWAKVLKGLGKKWGSQLDCSSSVFD
jgi:hypothetical protein